MTTTTDQRNPSTCDRRIADRLGVTGLAGAAGFGVFYWQVVDGRVDPPEGLIAILVAGIALSLMIKATSWIADRRAQQIETRHDQELTEVRDELRLLRQTLQERDDDAQATLDRTGQFIDDRSGNADDGSVRYLNRTGHGS